MKTILIAFIVSFFSFAAYSQNYYVLKVEGSIRSNEQILKKGDQLNPDAQISFSSSEDIIYLLSPKKGYKLLSPKINMKAGKNELVMAIKQAVLPQNKNYLTASRGSFDLALSEFEDIYDMMAFFKGKLIVTDHNYFPLNKDYFLSNPESYFELSSNHDIQTTLKLPVTDGKIFFSGNDLKFMNDPYTLVYIKENNRTIIGEFNIQFIDQEEIKELVSPFSDPTEKLTDYNIDQALYYLSDQMGKIHKSTLLALIQPGT